MKKFGTPTGAGPGSANEKVGFDEVGTPPGPFDDAGLVFFGFVLEGVRLFGLGRLEVVPDPLLTFCRDGLVDDEEVW
jgi:hypothetical protein